MHLPSGRFLLFSDVIEKIEVPLERSRRPKEAMETKPIVLPAGQFRLKGVSDGRTQLCNGEGCFGSPDPEARFVSRLRLAQFYVRSTGDVTELMIVPEELPGDHEVAQRTFSPLPGLRLHCLDDHAYLDPRGYWIRAGERSHFVMEGDCVDSCSLLLANGGRENWIEVSVRETNHRFSLGPWERRQVAVATDDDTLPLSVMSVAGFRPSELDASVDDSRHLGVFLTLEIGKSGDRPH
jgi:hypothetical protein